MAFIFIVQMDRIEILDGLKNLNCLDMILVDIQGATGKKVDYHSIPYKSIRHFAVESTGHFDLEAELKIWVAGLGAEPLVYTFSKDADVYRVQALLAECVGK